MRTAVFRHAASFLRTGRSLGWTEAVVRGIRYAARRSGLPGPEEAAALRAEAFSAHSEAAALRAETRAARADTVEACAAIEADRVRLDETRRQLTLHGESLAWLARHHLAAESTGAHSARSTDGPLVSVVMPVWNRREQVAEAVDSVRAQTYERWELILVDDGSDDCTREALAGLRSDARLRVVTQTHLGAAAARNRALAESRGEIIAYLDSDDVWYPGFLAAVVRVFEAEPDRDAAYGALLVSSPDPAETFLRCAPFERHRLLEGNFIPMTAFVHRRRLYEQIGGFDESLTRLMDWDLILRYAAASEPLRVPVIAGEYRFGPWPRISNAESVALNTWKIRRKHEPLPQVRPRVLYALEFAPTLSESYVQAEMACMRRWGADIELWSEYEPPAPCSVDVPVHRCDLAAAIAKANPHVVHVHHLHRALRYLPEVVKAHLPMTVRAHGVDFDAARMDELRSNENVAAVYVFPHQAKVLNLIDGKVRSMPVAFDPDRYYPVALKDRRLVVRASLAAPAKGLDTFVRLAARHRSHRFVLFACWSVGFPHHLEELKELNRSLGSPADIRVDRPYDEVASVVREAAIYAHTPSLEEPYGMPISISEAMATGCYVIVRRCAASEAYVADAGALYDAEDEAAALLDATASWPEDRWRQAGIAAIDRAFGCFASDVVLPPLFEDWIRLSGRELASAPVPVRATA
jgi:glycosyltransferase involved in cell wall biosynthesis